MANTNTFELRITGFRSKAEVEVFIDWYSGQGEQDIDFSLELAEEKGLIDRSSLNVDGKQTYPIQFVENVGLMVINS